MTRARMKRQDRTEARFYGSKILMSKVRRAVDSLIANMAQTVRAEALDELRPIVDRIVTASRELEAALQGADVPRRRGRPPKGAPPVLRARPRRAHRAPRGALKAAIQEVLRAAAGPVSLSAIRDHALKSPHFRGRDAMTLYRQIVRDIALLPQVHKVRGGLYTIEAGRTGKRAKG